MMGSGGDVNLLISKVLAEIDNMDLREALRIIARILDLIEREIREIANLILMNLEGEQPEIKIAGVPLMFPFIGIDDLRRAFERLKSLSEKRRCLEAEEPTEHIELGSEAPHVEISIVRFEDILKRASRLVLSLLTEQGGRASVENVVKMGDRWSTLMAFVALLRLISSGRLSLSEDKNEVIMIE
ncbi:MAG: hypothetical protein ACTSXJ_00845 [Candidatus Baldrarchaeia archaeon]